MFTADVTNARLESPVFILKLHSIKPASLLLQTPWNEKTFTWFTVHEDRKCLKPRRHNAFAEIGYLKYLFLAYDGLTNGPRLKYFSIKSSTEVTHKETRTTYYIFTSHHCTSPF